MWSLLRGSALGGMIALLAAAPAWAQRPSLPQPGLLRVCADPDNMPLSNQQGEGFENKIAELIAKEFHSELKYAWWPVRRGFFARALNGRYCDIAIQAPRGLDMAAVTDPYYRSGYFFVSRKDRGLADLKSLSDPRLKNFTIGIHLLNSDAENTPPAMALSRYGVVGNLKGYTTFYSDIDRPEDIIEAVANKEVDVAIVWGPIAGYFVKQAPTPMVMTPLAERDSLSDYPFRFNIAMGVRRRDRELRDSLNAVLEKRAPEIQAILKQYGVPTFPIPEEEQARRDADEAKAMPAAAKPAAVGAASPPADSVNANLSERDLKGKDFKGANLAGANLFSSDLTDAVLAGADLSGANLDGTVLRRADLRRANLQGASLFATIIEGADLSGANLSKTRIIGYLRGAKLVGADLRNANAGADPGNQSMGVMRATFVGADLSDADLSGANLYKADLSYAKLTGARLVGADLRNAELVQTDLSRADLTRAKLAKANLDGAVFTGAAGVATIQGLDEARNRDKAVFDDDQ